MRFPQISRKTFVSSPQFDIASRERESTFEFSRALVECHVSLGERTVGGASGMNVARRALRQCSASFRRVLLVPSARRFLSRAHGREGVAVTAACSRRETPRDKSAFFLRRVAIHLEMADDSHENGTSNGDVPEIELIIKVSGTRALDDPRRDAWSNGGRGAEGGGQRRQVKTEEKRRSCPVRAVWAWNDRAFLLVPAGDPLRLLHFALFCSEAKPRDRENRPTVG